jgi:hypothetical protein
MTQMALILGHNCVRLLHMPMYSISICLNTLYMFNMDVGSSLRWLSATTMMYDMILTPQVSEKAKFWAN